jgi:hypothetical protein
MILTGVVALVGLAIASVLFSKTRLGQPIFQWLASEPINKSFDTVSKIVQILALVIAGWWTYLTFIRSVEPGLEFRGEGETNLTFFKGTDETTCIGSVNGRITNKGLTAFDVEEVTIKGWFTTTDTTGKQGGVPLPSPTTEKPSYINDYEIRATKQPFETIIVNKDSKGSSLIRHYPPGSNYDQSFTWLFLGKPGQNVLFQMEVTTKDPEQKIPPAWISSAVCSDIK